MKPELKRWLLDESTPNFERELLGSGVNVEPPAGSEQEIWHALLAKLPPPVGGSGTGPDPSPAAGTSGTGAAGAGGIAKALLTGLAGGLVVAVTVQLAAPERAHKPMTSAPSSLAPTSNVTALEAPPPSLDPAPVPAANVAGGSQAPSHRTDTMPLGSGQIASSEPVVAETAGISQPTNTVSFAPPPVPSGQGVPQAPVERASALRAESELLRSARAALRGGDYRSALSILNQSRARFPKAILSQEREALSIAALAQSGARDDARARAQQFLSEHPDSPHRSAIQELTR